MAKTILLSSREVTICYKDTLILEDINFEINEGEFVYVVGETGSGKSSFLKTLYADMPLTEGEIDILDYTIPIKKKYIPFLRRQLGIVFQDFELLNDRNVYDNLSFVLKAIDWYKKQKIEGRINEVLETLGIESLKYKMPHQISGGEKQRVAIGRALLNKPKLIIADEPTGNLDPIAANDILNLLISINQRGTSILLATHEHDFLKKFPSRTLYFRDKTLLDIAVEDLFNYL